MKGTEESTYRLAAIVETGDNTISDGAIIVQVAVGDQTPESEITPVFLFITTDIDSFSVVPCVADRELGLVEPGELGEGLRTIGAVDKGIAFGDNVRMTIGGDTENELRGGNASIRPSLKGGSGATLSISCRSTAIIERCVGANVIEPIYEK